MRGKKKTDPVVSCYFLCLGEKKKWCAGGVVSTQEFCEMQTKTGFIFVVVFPSRGSDLLSVLQCDAHGCMFKEE